MVKELGHISANALIPDQLLPYVAAVSGLESHACGAGVLHRAEDQGVLVAYPPQNTDNQNAIDETVNAALQFKDLKRLTVIAAKRPTQAPENAATQTDWYWSVPVDVCPAGKLANMLRRAARDATIASATGKEAWTAEHEALAAAFCQRKASQLDEGSIYLFRQMAPYLANAPDAVLFSARAKADNRLLALAIGDYTAFNTAFYMFAFRAADAPPGAADLLLASMVKEAANRGHSQVNLGLGINPGVEFFKRKWGARKFLPYAETAWDIAPQGKKSWFARLFGNK